MLFVILFASCGGTNTKNDDVEKDEVEVVDTPDNTEVDKKVEKTVEEQIVGSWYDESAISGFDIVFNKDGNFFWHSGSDEGEDTWKITTEGKLHFFGADNEILEITKTTLKITDGKTETVYTRNVE